MELKFSERYNEIISNAKQRNWNKEYCKQNFIYSELHHVVPKSIDASLINEDTNLVHFESQADAQRKSKELGWKGVRGSHIGSVINGNRKYCGTDTEGNCLHWKRKES